MGSDNAKEPVRHKGGDAIGGWCEPGYGYGPEPYGDIVIVNPVTGRWCRTEPTGYRWCWTP